MNPHPLPCQRFRKIQLTENFLAHLPDCPECLVVLGNLLAERSERSAKDSLVRRDGKEHLATSRPAVERGLAFNDPAHSPENTDSSSGTVPAAANETADRSQQQMSSLSDDDKFRRLITATSAFVYHTDSRGEPLIHNACWYQFTGQTSEEAKDGGWIEAVHPDDRLAVWEAVSRSLNAKTPYELENRVRRRDGEWRHVLVRGIPISDQDGVVREWMAYGHDITERKQREELLLQEAILDPLTGLYNRRFCLQGLAKEIGRAQRTGDPLVVVSFDLDGFKQINDRLGHCAGDFVLKEFARRLGKAVRGTDFAARLGGDEFLVVLSECPPGKVQTVLDRIAAFEAVYDGQEIRVSSSCGWIQLEPGETPDDLLRRADAALYANKQYRQAAADLRYPKPS